jgi:multicomponent Na+:H+ antiporter subunit E
MTLLLNAAVLFGLWLLLTGSLAPFYLVVGALTALVVAANLARWDDSTRFRLLPFLGFLPWLAWQVIRSNLRIARIVLTPKMPIHPVFIVQSPGVAGDRAVTTLGASMTLTPGTLTVDASDEEIFVHALDTESANDVKAGTMARHVARAFTRTGT